ncbi:MAG: amidohydrolase [Proteobacteria bacterium]|nr:amidohydrolase [Pseudomonadota bacterium]
MHLLLQKAFDLQDWSIAHRRHLHQHPELSLKEQQTSAYCQQVLQELGYQIKPVWGYGFIAEKNSAGAKRTIGWRADMDALPIQEKNTHDFISKNSGVTHACGHDGHMTVALTAAKIIAEHNQALTVNVRFIFQPSEETPPGGAIGMIAQGCLDGLDEIYGLHNDPGTPVGSIRLRNGPLLAAGDRFDLRVKGRGGHAARPHDNLDPVIAAAELITHWQSIISRRINPAHPAVLSVTQFKAGDVFNVIPDTAFLAGTVRSFYAADRRLIQNLMEISLEDLRRKGYQTDFKYTLGYDPVINHRSGVQRIIQAAEKILGVEQVDSVTDPEGWAEDFAYYLQHCPGAFFLLGSGNTEKGIVAPLHSSSYDFDEAAISYGAAMVAALVFMG